MERSILLIFCLSFAGGMIVAGQQPASEKGVQYVLSNPGVVKLEVLPRALELGEHSSLLTQPYTEGDRLRFRLQMTNNSIVPIEVPVTDAYAQNRAVLYKDGDILSYRKSMSELLESRENEPVEKVGWRAELALNESKVLDRIDLYEWYDGLGPGHYQLSIKHRFQVGQPWYESSSITFDIVAKSAPRKEG